MLLVFALMLLLAGGAAAAPQSPDGPATVAAGVEAARRGDHARALELLQGAAERDPSDLEARMWIGRVHLWMGHADRAEPVFRSLLAEDASNVEAMVGLASALLARNDPEAAVSLLERAEQRAPADGDVLAALGRAHSRAGRSTRAVSYLERVVVAAPTADNRLLLEELRRNHAHRIEASGFVEEFGAGVAAARAGDVAINLRASDTWRVFGRAQAQRKFGIADARGGGGIEWRLRPDTTLAAHHLAGPDNEVLPRSDSQFELSYARGRLEPAGSVRRLRFATARVWVMSPGMTIWWRDRLSTTARYYGALTDFDSATRQAASHSGLFRASYRLVPRVWVSGGYARGIENFETLTAERIGEFRADTGSAGLRLDLPSLTSAFAAYEGQRRSDGAIMHRVTVSLVHRF